MTAVCTLATLSSMQLNTACVHLRLHSRKFQHARIRIHFANNYYIKQDAKHAFLSRGKFYLLRVSSFLGKKNHVSYRFCWIQGSLADPQSLLGCSNEDQHGPPHSFFKIASLVAMHYHGSYSISGHFDSGFLHLSLCVLFPETTI